MSDKIQYYNADGTPWTREDSYAPIQYVPEEYDYVESGWYFVDETMLIRGPYLTMDEAIESCKNFMNYYLGGVVYE